MNAETTFRCDHYKATIKAEFCALRQTTVLEAGTGGRKGKTVWSGKRKYVPAHLAYCASAACEQGRTVLVGLGIKRLVQPPKPKKPCAYCGEWMEQQHRESKSTWNVRKFCDQTCAVAGRSRHQKSRTSVGQARRAGISSGKAASRTAYAGEIHKRGYLKNEIKRNRHVVAGKEYAAKGGT